LKKKNNINLEG